MIEDFKIDVPDDVIRDLKSRLRATRLAADFGNDEWAYGTNGAYLQELLRYWAEDYDWRVHECAMNALPHFGTVIDDVPIHFIHQRGRGPSPMPLIMSWDLQKVIAPLTDSAAHGGDAADAFDVIIPSLPGFGFSTPLTKPGVNFSSTADLWVTLMRRLGYDRFAAQGGDFGAFVTAQLGHKHASKMLGIHVHLAGPLGMISSNMPDA
jgi:hypothetical protein